MNKQLFLRLFKNIILNRLIFQCVHLVNLIIVANNEQLIKKWKEVLSNPAVMSRHGYLKELKQYYQGGLEDKPINFKEFLNVTTLLSARYNHLHVLRYLIEEVSHCNYQYLSFQKIFEISIFKGNREMAEYLYSLSIYEYRPKPVWDPLMVFTFLPLSRKLPLCKWYTSKYPIVKEILVNKEEVSISKYNNTNTEKIYEIKRMQLFLDQFLGNAAKSGCIDILDWAINYFEIDKDTNNLQLKSMVWRDAVLSKSIDMLNYMFKYPTINKTFYNEMGLVYKAIEIADINVLEWLFLKKSPYKVVSVLLKVVQFGTLEILTFIYQQLYHFTNFNSTNITEWLLLGCHINGIKLIDEAIGRGNLSLIKWIHENTVSKSHLSLNINHYTGSGNALDLAVDRGDIEMLSWFTTNNRQEGISSTGLNRLLTDRSNYQVVKWLLLNRTESFDNSVLDFILDTPNDNFEFIQWFTNNRRETGTSRAMDLAISKKNIDLIKWMHSNTIHVCTSFGFNQVLKFDDIEILTWLFENITERWNNEYAKYGFHTFSPAVQEFIIYNSVNSIPSNVLETVAKNANLSMHILKNYSNRFILEDTIVHFSKVGNLQLVQHVHQYYRDQNLYNETNHFSSLMVYYNSLKCAITNGHMDVVKYLFETGTEIELLNEDLAFCDDPMTIAVRNGHLSICKYLHSSTLFKANSDHNDIATKNGYLDLVTWMYQEFGFLCSVNVMEECINHGHHHILKFLVDINHIPTSTIFKHAIIKGDLDIIKQMKEYSVATANIVDMAAASGKLDIVKYLVDNGAHGTTDAIDLAAERGYLEIVDFLRFNNFKCTPYSINNAIKNKHIHVVEWLLANINFPTYSINENPIENYYLRNLILDYKAKKETKKRNSDFYTDFYNNHKRVKKIQKH